MKGFEGLIQQAREVQERIQKLQEELARAEVTGEAGAGLVRVVMNGRYDVRKVTIDPSLLREEPELLEDLVAAAINDAVRRVEARNREKMAELAAGLGLPPGLGLPL